MSQSELLWGSLEDHTEILVIQVMCTKQGYQDADNVNSHVLHSAWRLPNTHTPHVEKRQ